MVALFDEETELPVNDVPKLFNLMAAIAPNSPILEPDTDDPILPKIALVGVASTIPVTYLDEMGVNTFRTMLQDLLLSHASADRVLRGENTDDAWPHNEDDSEDSLGLR